MKKVKGIIISALVAFTLVSCSNQSTKDFDANHNAGETVPRTGSTSGSADGMDSIGNNSELDTVSSSDQGTGGAKSR